HLRLAHRSLHTPGGSRGEPAGHRTLEPRAVRRHPLVEVPAPPGVEQRALSADGAPGARGRGTRARALERSRAGRPVKVTEVRAIAVAIPLAPATPPSSWSAGLARQILVRVSTDEGLVGWGECFAYGATLAVCNVVDDALAPIVVGQDPAQIEQLVDRM